MTDKKIKNDTQDFSSDLVKACADFVRFKDDLDDANKTSYVQGGLVRKVRLLTGLYEPNKNNDHRSASALRPCDFVEKALPFIFNLNSYTDYERCGINPQLVVSGTFNSYNRDILGGYDNNYPDDVMNWSDQGVATKEKSSSYPMYFRSEILPLYIALEGKNRVELFKRHRKVMLAWIMKTESIPVADLMLICLKPFNIWAIHYADELRILPFSEFSLPIYRAAGVEEGRPHWDFLAIFKLRKIRLDSMSHQMRT